MGSSQCPVGRYVAHQRQVGDSQRVVCAVYALADAHAPIGRRSQRACVHACSLTDIFGWDAGDRLCPLGREAFERFNVFGETFRASLGALR